MNERPTRHDDELPAGRFSTWLGQFLRAQEDGSVAAVPCGTCTGCCTSSQFVHIGPEETAAISRIPPELLFAAPGLPSGHVLMGYDERGHCPMFVDGGCSIYDDRPRTCRTYDCRALVAAGLELNDRDKAAILERTRQWRFAYEAPLDHQLHDAVRAATAFLQEHGEELPAGAVPRQATQLAFLAIRIHHLFVDRDPATGEVTMASPSVSQVEDALLEARTRASG